MKLKIYIALLAFILFVSNSLISSTRLHSLNNMRNKIKTPKNKFTSCIGGVTKIVFPEAKNIKMGPCLSKSWKADSSVDASEQAENLILIYQMLTNYDQYLVKEVKLVCKIKDFTPTFFKHIWDHMVKVKAKIIYDHILKKEGGEKKKEKEDKPKAKGPDEPDRDDMFVKFGGFKVNTSYANKKLPDQVPHTIFNKISKTKVLDEVKTSKEAIKLRDIAVNSFNPMGVLSKILQHNFKELFTSKLFRGIKACLECLLLKFEKEDKAKYESLLKRFESRTSTMDDDQAIKLFSNLVCNIKKFKEITKAFRKINTVKEENDEFEVIGEVFGGLVNLVASDEKEE